MLTVLDYVLHFICHGFESVVTVATTGSFRKQAWLGEEFLLLPLVL